MQIELTNLFTLSIIFSLNSDKAVIPLTGQSFGVFLNSDLSENFVLFINHWSWLTQRPT